MFRIKFRTARNSFRDLPLTNARDISVHRAGAAPAKVTITGLFGVTYTGGPTELAPISETRQMPADLASMARPAPVLPKWTDFTIDGRSLFDECHAYLAAANNAIQEGKPIAIDVHAGAPLYTATRMTLTGRRRLVTTVTMCPTAQRHVAEYAPAQLTRACGRMPVKPRHWIMLIVGLALVAAYGLL